MNVEIAANSDATAIGIETDAPIKYTVLTLQNPHRVVLDVKNTNINAVLKSLSDKLLANNLHIQQIRIAKFQQDITRLVFDLRIETNVNVHTLLPTKPFKHRIIMIIGDAPEKAEALYQPLLPLTIDKKIDASAADTNPVNANPVNANPADSNQVDANQVDANQDNITDMQTVSEKKVDLKQSSKKITQPKIQSKNQPIIQPKTKNSAPTVDNGAKIVIDKIPVFEPEENAELENAQLENADALINQ